jgi:hypothetical protein
MALRYIPSLVKARLVTVGDIDQEPDVLWIKLREEDSNNEDVKMVVKR